MSATTVFVFASGLLAVLALGYVLLPLWRQRPLATAVMIGTLAVSASAIYLLVGTPQALDPQAVEAPRTLDDAIARLEQEVERNREEPEGWQLLGRAYAAQGRLAEARDAFAQVARLQPDNPDALVQAAEARAHATPGRRFDEAAVALLQRALKLNSAHQRARWFLGIAQRQAGKPAEAAETWMPLLAIVPPETAASLREQIDQARAEAGLRPLPPTAPATAAKPGPHDLRVRVAIAAGTPVPDGATLFVIARRPGGPPMPVAVEKQPAKDFPVQLTLDDGDSPMPTARLSALDEVEVFARLSRSGDATRQDGDLESAPVRVKLPATAPVELVVGAPAP